MKTFKKFAAQGEIFVKRISAKEIPSAVKDMKIEGGYYIVGHSETGHHHVIEATKGKVKVSEKAPEGMQIFYAILDNPTELRHLRDHDTHEPIKLEAGAYEIRTAREFDPFAELARRSID